MAFISVPARWIGIIALVAIAVGGPNGAEAHEDYTLANIAPETIPLWGPSWNHSPVTIAVEPSSGVTQEALDAVNHAIHHWNEAIATVGGAPSPFLQLVAPGTPADIVVRPKAGGGMVQGQALCLTDAAGFFSSCKVNVSGKAFGLSNAFNIVLSIAIQEIGHALGLLHAEGAAAAQDVMYGTLQDPPNIDISVCDVNAWAAVMAWLLAGTAPALPSVSSVSCEAAASGDPSSVDVSFDRTPPEYHNREVVTIFVTVKDQQQNPVVGAAVTVTVLTANGRTLSGSGQSDANGVATFTYRANARRDGFGTYEVTAEACNGSACATGAPTSFTVSP